MCAKETGYFKALDGGSSFEAEILFVKKLIIFDHRSQSLHMILKSDLKSAAQERTRLKQILKVCQTQASRVLPTPTPAPAQLPLKPVLGKQNFIKAVRKIKDHIKDGDIFQAVLAERFECEIQADALSVFSCLRKLSSSSAYSFYFNFEHSRFFGASPEMLIKIEDEKIETHPIAGTYARGSSIQQDQEHERQLLGSVKESAEHLMLVDLARNDLGRVCEPGTVKVKAFRQIMRLTHIMHIISKVEGKLNAKYSELDALKACFPAGTLSGAPKIRAIEILAQLEEYPRGLYGGAVVAFDFAGGLDSCIAIRAIEMSNGKAILRAGAGIVADSDPVSEYQEVQNKLKTVYQALGIAEAEAQYRSEAAG